MGGRGDMALRQRLLELITTDGVIPFPTRGGGSGKDRPTIQVNNRFLREVVADAVAALQKANEPPTLFVRGSELVRVPEDSAHAEPLTVAALRVLMDQAADFAKIKDTEDGEEIRPARPPRDVAESILAIPPRDAFPKLAGIRSQPVFLPDGRLLARGGYDPESGLLMRLRGLDGVRDDMPADEALRWLFDELLVDFPFEDEAGRAHALALLLEPFVRPLIDGPTPLYLIDAPVRGTGKGLLAAVCCLVATGRRPDVMTLVRSDPEEHEKRITALLLAGAQWVLLDNVETLASAPLAAVLTTTRWRGRRLGKSEMVDLPNDATWVATGNNVHLSDEIARRTIPIRLDPGVERPEYRTGFRHPDLLEWAAAHRVQLVSACLSLVRAWLDVGRPEGDMSLGSYEAWSRVMGGILRVAGVPGFLGGRERLYAESDRETAEWRALCEAWWECYGDHPVTAKDVFDLCKEHGFLLDVWGGRSALSAQQRLGRALAAMRDRVFGRFRIRPAGRDGRTKNAAYRLEERSAGGAAKTPETPETPPAAEGTLVGQGFAATGGVGCFAPKHPQTPAQNTETPHQTPEGGEARNPHGATVSGADGGVTGVSGVSTPPAASTKTARGWL